MIDPCKQPVAATAAALPQQQEKDLSQSAMGPQSQKRLTLHERTHHMQSQSHRKKQRGGQQTLFGDRAFDPLKDCDVCKGKLGGRSVHRAHHKLCWNKRGSAVRSQSTLDMQAGDKRLQVLFSTPLTEAEKCSGKHLTEEAGAAFFAARKPTAGPSVSVATTTTRTTATEILASVAMTDSLVAADDLCGGVTEILQDPSFLEVHKCSRAPLPMLAFAKTAVEKVVRPKDVDLHACFNGTTMTVPATNNAVMGPQCHSAAGQKLLHIDWQKMCGH